MQKLKVLTAYIILAAVLFSGCSSPSVPASRSVDVKSLDTSAAAATIESLNVSAPGNAKAENDDAVIDYSNVSEGYVMVRCSKENAKAQIKGPKSTYTYSLSQDVWAAFPLSEGNGQYFVMIFENVEGTRYAMILSADFSVSLIDEFAPFLRPNQYVNFAEAPESVAVAAELTKSCETTLDKVAALYGYIISNITYDKQQAATVKAGYLPVLDDVLERKTGICFDYASLITGMLRSLQIPSKLIIGYAGGMYHAWISVWIDGQGWVDNLVYFDGVSWSLMDPTYASVDGNEEFIADSSNYTAKYFY